MVKFIHTADWQIGMRAAHVGVVAQQVRAARLAAGRRVIEAAQEFQADFIIVAGDTFEDNAVDRVLVQKVADLLASFGGPVYMIPGNHDPLVPGSVWEHAAWQSHANLHVCSETQPLDIGHAILYPCPLWEKHSRKDPTHWIRASDDARMAIGMAHGTVAGVSPETLDYPIARDAATRGGLDYLALGHWHSFAEFPEATGCVRMAYAGSHETTKFGERDSGNVLLVEISERGAVPTLRAIRTGGLIWKQLDEQVTDLGDLVRLRRSIESWKTPEQTLLDLRIRGILDQDAQEELVRLDELVRARVLYARLDTSRLLPRPDDQRWLAALPPGALRRTAERLQQLSDPTYSGERPTGASSAVATRALMDLFRLVREEGR